MRLIADSTVVIDLWRHRRRPERTIRLRERLVGHQPALPWMAFYEFAHGHFYRARSETELNAFLAPFELLPATRTQVLSAARIATSLQRQGLTPGAADTWIAAAALEEDIPVLTRNGDHFNRVPGLQVIEYTILP